MLGPCLDYSTPENQTVLKNKACVAADDAHVSTSKEYYLLNKPVLEGVTAAE
jgi:hypothetical protein